MKTMLFMLFCGLLLAAPIQAGESCQAPFDVVKPRVPDKLCRVALNQQELGGEIDRRIKNLIYQNYMVVDLDGKWLDHFRNRTDRGDRQYVYYGIGKVFDAGSLFAAYTGDPKVAARTQYIIDELVKSRDADGYLGFWNVEPENRQNHINWILHEQEYINLALVRNYRSTGNPQSLAHAKIMGDYILKTFPTPQNPCYDAGEICTAGLPEGMLELYRVTGDKRYFDFAADVPHGNSRGEVQLASLRTWEQDVSRRPCHVYVMLARCYAQTELYRLTGEENLLNMSQFMRNELLKDGEGGMLVTGSCSEGEHFTYNQNGRGAIGESCVTAYVLRWMDSLMRLEGDMRYGDVLERTIYNALLAANSPDGRWIRYFTPFTGDRQYDTRDFFCCCGNYRRAVAELPQKVYCRTPEDGIALILFTNSKKSFDVKGQAVTILQEAAYPNDGNVKLTFSTQNPVAFAFQFRTPRWCEKITLRVNDEVPVTIDPSGQKLGCYVLNRTWKDGDVVGISMPMAWRFLRGRAIQYGRVVLLRGPIVYCIGKDQNAELLVKCPEPRNLVIDPASVNEPVRDDSIRPNGLKVVAKAWLNQDCTGEKVDVTLTEFIDPSGQDVYFCVPNLADTSPVGLTDDEIVSWPNEFVNAHVLKAFYGPKATGDLEGIFEIRGDVVADLAADYVNPGGKTGVTAEFPDAAGGRWAFYNCKNGGLLSTASASDVKPLNSRFKAFGSPLGYAYGLENQGDELGFASNYAPSDRQEDAWRDHYTEHMFDQVLADGERNEFLYTHPISDTACYNVFRWTPSADVQKKDVTLCGTLFSNLGNGVELRVIRCSDDTRHEVLGTFNTKDLTVGKCGTAQFVLRLRPGEVSRHLDFVLHNAGSHICDATALRIRAYTNVERAATDTDVTEQVQAKFHNRLVTPLGPYPELFGKVAPGAEKTLKVKLHFWRDGVVKYLEFPQDAALDLTEK
ncbi:MAG TPA: beta-L-arabinofuranosidase domain-containing protein [Thermoguttaceae bacterium]|nr:beta-L-arabinofuranosidase domain-containing protein [Thermoguttaceae bacterium]